jgi:hypothetical protein
MDGMPRNPLTRHDGSAGMTDRVKPEVVNPGLFTEPYHQLLRVTDWPFPRNVQISDAGIDGRIPMDYQDL